MKTAKEAEKNKIKLNSFEQDAIKGAIQTLDTFVKGEAVTETGLQTLENICRDLNSIRENYCQKIINLIKMGNQLD